MYAIIKAGGKQYKVTEGTILKVEKLKEDDTVEFKEVLMVSDGEKNIFGTPYVEEARVRADILNHGRDKKVLVFKQIPRKNHRKLNGHRQHFTRIRIKEITMGGAVSEEHPVESTESLSTEEIIQEVSNGT